jgi:predicted aminopeptidase
VIPAAPLRVSSPLCRGGRSRDPARPVPRSVLGGVLAAALLLTGCAGPGSGVGYYWQSVSGHLQLMQAARPVGDWLNDAQTPARLKQRLALTQRMRAFSINELGLPDNASYRRYADLHRRAAVYNVVAAPPLSLALQTWCFPVVGCVGYRGYFNEADARQFALSLPDTLEVAVYPVPAYSTLGWMNWAGGDPLLNTFVGYPEGEVARLLFHELAHQVVYAKNDTRFNESFATAVERLGGERWLASEANESTRREYAVFDRRRQEFRELTRATRQGLETIYQDATLDDAQKLDRKAAAMNTFRQNYAALKATWGGFAGYDPWVAQANNASFGAQAAYDDLVPAFIALFQREGQSFPRFYDAVRALADQPAAQRLAALQALADGPPVAQGTADLERRAAP